MELLNKNVNTHNFGTKLYFDKATKKIYGDALSSKPKMMIPEVKIFRKQNPGTRVILRKTGEYLIPTRINPNGYKIHIISAENPQNKEIKTFNICDTETIKQINFADMFKELMGSETFWRQK